MGIFSKKLKRKAEPEADLETPGPATDGIGPAPMDAISQNEFDENGYRFDINTPVDGTADLNQEILKYRSSDGQYQFVLALYANYPDLKANFEGTYGEIPDIIYNLFLLDESYAYKIWKWLLVTFHSILTSPANSYRLISGPLYALSRRQAFFEYFLPCLKSDVEFSGILFRESTYVDKRHALILAACIEKQEYALFQELMAFLKENPHLGRENAATFENILQTILEEIPSPTVNHDSYALLSGYIKQSAKPMLRKILFKVLDSKMEYLLKEEAREKAEKERAKRLEEQGLQHQNDIAFRLNLRNTKLKYHELKLACISQRKKEPYWENGRFIDFQALAGTMIALKERIEILDSLLPGDRVELVREPYNIKDPASISVQDESGVKLGYISNQANTLLSFIMDSGKELFGRIYSLGKEPGSDIVQICIEIFMKKPDGAEAV